MIRFFLAIYLLFFFFGCSQKTSAPIPAQSTLEKVDMLNLDGFGEENFDEVLNGFVASCKTNKTKKLYGSLCQSALHVSDKKTFIQNNFEAYRVMNDENDTGMLTGYYEPELHGSLYKHGKYIYPLYEKPRDLDRVTPYYTRAQHKFKKINAKAICYVDNKIDAYFLEVQGSGRVLLENKQTIYVGYGGNNGYPYTSIGAYLAQTNELGTNAITLETIKEWAEQNPKRVDTVLNQNKRVVYFRKKQIKTVRGSLGIDLTPMRSVAVDSNYIPLGSMLFIDANDQYHDMKRIVFAQDCGAAIKSSLRADLFTGFGDDALLVAGNLKAKLKMWILLPKRVVQ